MPKLKGGLGMYLALTGYRLKSVDCLHAGIATHICHQEEIPSLRNELISLTGGKETDIAALLNTYDSKFPKDTFSLQEVLPHIDQCFNKSSVEEILQSLDDLDNAWCKKTKDQFKHVSPTSVKISFEQLTRGKTLSSLKAWLLKCFGSHKACLLYLAQTKVTTDLHVWNLCPERYPKFCFISQIDEFKLKHQ